MCIYKAGAAAVRYSNQPDLVPTIKKNPGPRHIYPSDLHSKYSIFLNMLSQTLLLALAGIATAFPNTLAPRATFSGTATFNDYIKQGQTVCGPLSG